MDTKQSKDVKSPFKYSGSYANEISFPLGGIGAGCIGLAGNGRLIDWEIFNKPNKGSLNGMSHFAVKADHNGKFIDARILNGDLHPPYTGEMGCPEFNGFGWGPRRGNLSGMPHFREHVFTGRYPFAQIDFEGEQSWPGTVSLEAWSPFIPCNDYDSSLPCAFFTVTLGNTTDKTINYTVVGALSNPFKGSMPLSKVSKNEDIYQLTLTDSSIDKNSPEFGDITISTSEKDVSYQEYWYRGRWCDDLEIYYQDLKEKGHFSNRQYTEGTQKGFTGCDTGHLAVHITLGPGESRSIDFLISWNIPNCINYWRGGEKYEARMRDAGVENCWKNWYAGEWKDSRASGLYSVKNRSRLYRETLLFMDSLYGSSLPGILLEAVSSNLAILKSPTCLRLEDGTFYGWEGTGTDRGICEGSCTHVWNYAQTLPFLFPSLERSMRTANYKYNVDEHGGNHFRIHLPLGMPANINDFRPCADGQFGDIIKTYRDWKLSGNTEWLRDLWPIIRSTIEYAWSSKNPDRWDPDRTGVLWGRQHHTLDMELFGPNAWLTGYYLGALKAASEMAPVCNDMEFGLQCEAIFEKGKHWVDENLFNDEYFYHDIDLKNKDLLTSYDIDSDTITGDSVLDAYWSKEHKEIKYQIGEGCQINATIAQWHANICGLGEIFDPKKLHTALKSTYKYNFRESMRSIANPWRIYVLNDESGMLVCSWPDYAKRPLIPLPYSQEDQAGYTYATAAEMIQTGMIEEGIILVNAIRNRYDGFKRNPYNEIECGSNYARSMASFSLLQAYSGFSFDMSNGIIGFNPITKRGESFKSFWSLDSGWGTVFIDSMSIELKLLYGRLILREYHCDDASNITRITIDGIDIDFTVKNGIRIVFNCEAEITEKLIMKKHCN